MNEIANYYGICYCFSAGKWVKTQNHNITFAHLTTEKKIFLNLCSILFENKCTFFKRAKKDFISSLKISDHQLLFLSLEIEIPSVHNTLKHQFFDVIFSNAEESLVTTTTCWNIWLEWMDRFPFILEILLLVIVRCLTHGYSLAGWMHG